MNTAFASWFAASRPKTLPLACLAITLGSFLAWLEGSFSAVVLVLSLLTASLLQILSNLANDYGDGLRGVDNQERLGPTRALQSGALTAKQMLFSLWLVSFCTLASGLALLLQAQLSGQQWLVFLGFGACSLLAALTYTLGKKPYGYYALGDLSVGLFFGLLGVLGSFYLHGANLNPSLLLPALASGCLAIGVLNINNLRDIENDAANGKFTLAVFLGFGRGKLYQYGLIMCAYVLFASYLISATSFLALAVFCLVGGLVAGYFLLQVKNSTSSQQIGQLLPRMVGLAISLTSLFMLVLV